MKFCARFPFLHLLSVLILFGASLNGCTTEIVRQDRFIRDTTYIVVPRVIRDTLPPIIVCDTLIEFIRVNYGKDTIIHFRYFPKKEVAYIYVKPDTVRIKVRDTLTTTKDSGSNCGGFWTWVGVLAAVAFVWFVYEQFIKQKNKRADLL